MLPRRRCAAVFTGRTRRRCGERLAFHFQALFHDVDSSYPVIGQVAVGNGEVDPGDKPIGELG
jgi:hypothetical protein